MTEFIFKFIGIITRPDGKRPKNAKKAVNQIVELFEIKVLVFKQYTAVCT